MMVVNPMKEGWDVFDIDSTGRLAIQKFDDAAVFSTDEAALNFVITQAAQGDLQCRAALFAVNFSHPEYMSERGLNALAKNPSR
jgi:hypothetical protein